MGVPLVATRLAHPPLLREDFNGVLVGESPAALRDGLSALARDRSRLETLRAGARATSTELDWDLHVDRVLGIYERAISLRHHPRT
jgi:glycosyltransferase involved in cell wall biosynthesis